MIEPSQGFVGDLVAVVGLDTIGKFIADNVR
jgi:hypothetical protein